MEVSLIDCPHHSGVEAEIRAMCHKMEMISNAQEKALNVAKNELERRLEGMNEFRDKLDEQANTFVGKTESKLEVEKLITRIVLLEKIVNYREGSKHWSDHIVTVIIAFAVMVLAHYFWKQ